MIDQVPIYGRKSGNAGWSRTLTHTGTVTLETLYEEIKDIRRLLEELMEKGLTNVLPEEELSGKEWQEIAEIEAEVEKGEYVTLEDAMRRHVKQGAKV